jgi:DNA repair protein RadA/Sms
MAKSKTVYTCRNCGNSSAKWMGRCPACGEWNTYIEEVITRDEGKRAGYEWKSGKGKTHTVPVNLENIEGHESIRLSTGDKELDRALGGGIVAGSLILIGGEPGIGKSTLMLQMARGLSGRKILYVSGEESATQIKMRAERLGIKNPEYLVYTETNTQRIFLQAKKINPDVVIIDSIQTLYSEHIDSTPGSVSQVRECTGEWQRYAKETGTPVFLIGHITKEGSIAGPKLLEHMVDTVLQFEGDRHHQYRILRTVKNRFGSTAEMGIYEMQGNGLREVSNPSEILISTRPQALSGIAIAAIMEGMRSMLIEVQALVTTAVYGTPQRSATGFDLRRLNMLLAVLEKRIGFPMGNKDIFLNMAGGIRVDDPAADLAIVSTLISSLEDHIIPPRAVFTGEVGLSGEIRPVNRIEQRLSEADKLGFECIYLSSGNLKGIDRKKFNCRLIEVNKVEELLRLLF